MNNGDEHLIEIDFNNKTYKTGFNCTLYTNRIIIKRKDMEYLFKKLKENNFRKII